MDGSAKLYGTTSGGGSTYNLGTAFEMTLGGTETVLHDFGGGASAYPEGGLIFDSDSNLYGTTTGNADCKIGCYGTVFRMNAQHVVTILYFFRDPASGSTPHATLVMDGQGNLYGTTIYGGTYGDGTVFKLTPQGVETVLHSFEGGTDGANPNGSLAVDAKGNLYGTTQNGGSTAVEGGWGTVFKVTPSGSESVLYAFQGATDGTSPFAGVILDSSGNLYGTTALGGSTSCALGQDGCGTVFKLTPKGTKTLLYSFAGGTDGLNPEAPLVRDSKGNLYGTAIVGGGTLCGGYGCGVVFKVTPGGKETVLHRFIETDGGFPQSGLILDSHGDLYGTTFDGGNLADCEGRGCGVLFAITP
jgi:uncharacterized repeat protein (TIGR03803 family)